MLVRTVEMPSYVCGVCGFVGYCGVRDRAITPRSWDVATGLVGVVRKKGAGDGGFYLFIKP